MNPGEGENVFVADLHKPGILESALIRRIRPRIESGFLVQLEMEPVIAPRPDQSRDAPVARIAGLPGEVDRPAEQADPSVVNDRCRIEDCIGRRSGPLRPDHRIAGGFLQMLDPRQARRQFNGFLHDGVSPCVYSFEHSRISLCSAAIDHAAPEFDLPEGRLRRIEL